MGPTAAVSYHEVPFSQVEDAFVQSEVQWKQIQLVKDQAGVRWHFARIPLIGWDFIFKELERQVEK